MTLLDQVIFMADMIFIYLRRNQVESVHVRLDISMAVVCEHALLLILGFLFHGFWNMTVFHEVMLKPGTSDGEFLTTAKFAYVWFRPSANISSLSGASMTDKSSTLTENASARTGVNGEERPSHTSYRRNA